MARDYSFVGKYGIVEGVPKSDVVVRSLTTLELNYLDRQILEAIKIYVQKKLCICVFLFFIEKFIVKGLIQR